MNMTEEEQRRVSSIEDCALGIVAGAIAEGGRRGLSYAELSGAIRLASHLAIVMMAVPGREAEAVADNAKASGELGAFLIENPLSDPAKIAGIRAAGLSLGLEV